MGITGVAANVPFTALPPAGGGPAPLLVTWHMLDAPRTDAAFAAALPMAGVPAWRVHLGMPMCGARMVDGSMTAVIDLATSDPLLAYIEPFVTQAVAEFPAALASLREQLPVTEEPVAVVGGSLGGMVALAVLASGVPVRAAALVNPAVRARSVVDLFGAYPWDASSHAVAGRLDFVARAGDLGRVPLLVVSGELDHPGLRADAAELVAALPDARLVTVPDLAHPLAEEPGLAPAPQTPGAKAVDDVLTSWFAEQLSPTDPGACPEGDRQCRRESPA